MGQPDEAAVAAAVAALVAGELVCYPTESTYGIAADAASPAALARLVAIKGRDPRSPFGLVAHDRASARAVARVWPAEAERLAALYWPGPLTLVVPEAEGTAPEIIGPHGVGVRVPAHVTARALAAGLGRPITATSANRSGTPSAVVVAEARAAFGDAIAVYLDGGVCAGTPSTVVAIGPDGALQRIRAGAIAI